MFDDSKYSTHNTIYGGKNCLVVEVVERKRKANSLFEKSLDLKALSHEIGEIDSLFKEAKPVWMQFENPDRYKSANLIE